jgi:hypothetical protein
METASSDRFFAVKKQVSADSDPLFSSSFSFNQDGKDRQEGSSSLKGRKGYKEGGQGTKSFQGNSCKGLLFSPPCCPFQKLISLTGCSEACCLRQEGEEKGCRGEKASQGPFFLPSTREDP